MSFKTYPVDFCLKLATSFSRGPPLASHMLFNLNIFNSPLMVAASGEGRIRQAPQRSTMQRFLIMTNVTMLFLMSLLMILMMTLQLVMMLIRRMTTMTPHWSGCENRNTGPDVLIVSEVRIYL